MTKTKKWVTIAVRGDHQTALRAEKKLRKAGVPARLLEDVNEPHEVAFHWAPRASLGGTAIQVDARVVEEACEILGVPMPDDGDDPRPAAEGDAESNAEVRRAAYLSVLAIALCLGFGFGPVWVAVVGAAGWSLMKCANVWSHDLGVFGRRERRAVVLVDVMALIMVTGFCWREYNRPPPLTDEQLAELRRRPLPPLPTSPARGRLPWN